MSYGGVPAKRQRLSENGRSSVTQVRKLLQHSSIEHHYHCSLY